MAKGRLGVTSIDDHELFLIGAALYWAEGTKRSGQRVGMMVDFANSDPAMIAMFIKWLFKCCGVKPEEITLRLHVHEAHRHREVKIQAYWLEKIGTYNLKFGKTLFKKHNPKNVRKNTGETYVGLVSVRVQKSTALQRRIMGWIYAIIATQKDVESFCT